MTTTKYQTYPKYKPSGIDWLGNIPEGWNVKRLKYISNTRVSNVDKKSEDEVPVKLCNYIDVYKNKSINEKIDFMMATATSSQISSFELKTGDVILTKDSEEPDDIGIPAHVDLKDTKNVVCGYHLAIATPHDSVLLGKYLFRLFQSNIFRSYFEVSSHGVTRFGLDAYSIFNANIALPSLPEQHAIADYLDRETKKIDEVVAKKQKLIELLLEKRQAIISQAVTKGLNPKAKMKNSGIPWLGKIPEGWEVKRLRYISNEVKTGSTPDSENIEYFELGNIMWFTPGDFGENIDLSLASRKITTKAILDGKAKLFKKDSILLIGIGATLGKIGFCATEFSANQQINVIYINDHNFPRFYAYYLMAIAEIVISTSNASTLGILNQEKTKQILCVVPSKQEQIKIVEYIDRQWVTFENIIKKIELQNQKLQEFRQALISNAVTGKVRVS